MEHFHCNGCAHLPQYAGPADQRRYFISSCGHVFCQNCAINSRDNCGVCKAACRLVEVNAQSKPEIKTYFMDPMSIVRESLKQAAQVFQFQKAQTKSYQSVLARLVDAQRRTISEVESLKKNNSALERENIELKRKIENIEQEQQSWIGSGGQNQNEGTHSNFLEPNVPSTPKSFGSIFGHKGSAESSAFPPRGFLTPANINTPFGGNRSGETPNPLFTSGSATNSGSKIFFGPGRLTMPRTPNSENTPTSERFSPLASQCSGVSTFSAAPGSGRPRHNNIRNNGETPDLVSRLRHLRCASLANAGSTPGSHLSTNFRK